MRVPTIVLSLTLLACSSSSDLVSSSVDAGTDTLSALDGADAALANDADALADAADASEACFVGTVGVHGQCMTTSACASLGPYVSTPGYCPGPADVECCTKAPNVADDPPIPSGWKLMSQSQVTTDMTTWAVAILHDPVTYPMFSTTTKTCGTQLVMARVEWHPPDFQNSVVHRGVTLYVPA